MTSKTLTYIMQTASAMLMIWTVVLGWRSYTAHIYGSAIWNAVLFTINAVLFLMQFRIRKIMKGYSR